METKKFKTFDEFKKEFVADQNIRDQFKNDPINAINQFESVKPLDDDVWIYRIVVSALGFTILAIVIGVIFLIGMEEIEDDKGVPTILTAVGSAAIGALAGLLAPQTKNS